MHTKKDVVLLLRALMNQQQCKWLVWPVQHLPNGENVEMQFESGRQSLLLSSFDLNFDRAIGEDAPDTGDAIETEDGESDPEGSASEGWRGLMHEGWSPADLQRDMNADAKVKKAMKSRRLFRQWEAQEAQRKRRSPSK